MFRDIFYKYYLLLKSACNLMTFTRFREKIMTIFQQHPFRADVLQI
jgi:hypothetical protein